MNVVLKQKMPDEMDPADTGLELLDDFEVLDLQNLRDLAGNFVAKPTIVQAENEIEAFEERQAEQNFEFMTAVSSALPSPVLTANHVYKDFFQRVETTAMFEFTHHKAKEAADQAKEVAALRSGILWLERSLKDVADTEIANANKTKVSWKRPSVMVPYALAGIKRGDDKNESDQVLLLSLYGDEMSKSDNFSDFGNFKNGQATTTLRPHLVVAEVNRKSVNSLLALQNVMLADGVSQDELDAAIDDDGIIKIDADTVPVFRVKSRSSKTLRFHKSPVNPRDIDEEDFDISIVNDEFEGISLDAMRDYRSPQYLQRSAVMLGHGDVFHDLYHNWKDSLETHPLDQID